MAADDLVMTVAGTTSATLSTIRDKHLCLPWGRISNHLFFSSILKSMTVRVNTLLFRMHCVCCRYSLPIHIDKIPSLVYLCIPHLNGTGTLQPIIKPVRHQASTHRTKSIEKRQWFNRLYAIDRIQGPVARIKKWLVISIKIPCWEQTLRRDCLCVIILFRLYMNQIANYFRRKYAGTRDSPVTYSHFYNFFEIHPSICILKWNLKS